MSSETIRLSTTTPYPDTGTAAAINTVSNERPKGEAEGDGRSGKSVKEVGPRLSTVGPSRLLILLETYHWCPAMG